jgi:hypothetical protein
MSPLRAVAILVGKDLLSEWHSKEVLSATVSFALLALTVINFGFEPGRFQAQEVGPGILWTAFLFAAFLGMNRVYHAEHERGGLEGLMLCPVERTTLYVAKCCTLYVLLATTAVATLFLFVVFFNVRTAGMLPQLHPAADRRGEVHGGGARRRRPRAGAELDTIAGGLRRDFLGCRLPDVSGDPRGMNVPISTVAECLVLSKSAPARAVGRYDAWSTTTVSSARRQPRVDALFSTLAPNGDEKCPLELR